MPLRLFLLALPFFLWCAEPGGVLRLEVAGSDHHGASSDGPSRFAGATRSSPFSPGEASDTLFYTDEGPSLDTPCTFRSGGPLVISVLIDRYIGPTKADGTLADVQTLIDNKIISAKAKLRIPSYDVDSSTFPPGGVPEKDTVTVNGATLPQALSGINDQWTMNEFEIDIAKIKFPSSRGAGGAKPTPAANQIRIDIDTGNTGEPFCTAVDWVELRFEAMAPLVLVHGIDSSPATWVPDVTKYLDFFTIPYDNSVQLTPNGRVAPNGAMLAGLLPGIAASFGVKGIHLVVHSKGGLDSRRFLAAHYRPNRLKVLSLHTLSTPHHGSILADLGVAQRLLSHTSSSDTDLDNYLNADFLAASFGAGPALPGIFDLQTGVNAAFTRANAFPASVKFYTYGADADNNNNRSIEDTEYDPLLDPRLLGAADFAASLMYRVLARVNAITITRGTSFFGLYVWHDVKPVRPEGWLDNDLAVTDLSSHHAAELAHSGPYNRNHATIKDGFTMRDVLARIRADFPVN